VLRIERLAEQIEARASVAICADRPDDVPHDVGTDRDPVVRAG
jgi:hypothetical protein